MDKTAIKLKIRALLDKTVENGATPSEMEVALAKASQLMAKFFIAEHELADPVEAKACVMGKFDLIRSGFTMHIYYGKLAKLFDCQHYYNERQIVFFGYPQDVEMCGYFYYLIGRCALREKERFAKTLDYAQLKTRNSARSVSASFVKGFLYGVNLKLEEMYQAKQTQIPDCYALVVQEKKQQIATQFADLSVNIRQVKTKLRAGEQAFVKGKVRGEEIELNPGLPNASNRAGLTLR